MKKIQSGQGATDFGALGAIPQATIVTETQEIDNLRAALEEIRSYADESMASMHKVMGPTHVLAILEKHGL